MSVIEIILVVIIGGFGLWYVIYSIWEITHPDQVKAKKEAKKQKKLAKKEAKKQKKEESNNADEY